MLYLGVNSPPMLNFLVLLIVFLIFSLVFFVVIRGILNKIPIIGKPPVKTVFFITAKMMVVVNLTFLVMAGLNIKLNALFDPVFALRLIALVLLVTGTAILYVTTIQLNKDLIFGLPDSEKGRLQTKGLFAFSRHPFYLGFILILFSSCLLYPNPLNITAFLTAWIIHHFIMIEEEKFLETVYGEEYRIYRQKVGRYLTIK